MKDKKRGMYMGGGRSSMDTGKRPGQRLMPDAMHQKRMGRAMGGGKKRGMYAGGGLASAMQVAKAN